MSDSRSPYGVFPSSAVSSTSRNSGAAAIDAPELAGGPDADINPASEIEASDTVTSSSNAFSSSNTNPSSPSSLSRPSENQSAKPWLNQQAPLPESWQRGQNTQQDTDLQQAQSQQAQTIQTQAQTTGETSAQAAKITQTTDTKTTQASANENPQNPDDNNNNLDYEKIETQFPLRKIRVALLAAKPIPLPILSLVEAFQSVKDDERGFEVGAPFTEVLISPPDKNELVYTRSPRHLTNYKSRLYPADVGKLLEEIIDAYIDIEQQSNITSWGELQSALASAGLRKTDKATITNPEEEVFKNSIKTSQFRAIANSIWPILIKINENLAKEQKVAVAEQPTEDGTEAQPAQASADTASPTGQDQGAAPDGGAEAANQDRNLSQPQKPPQPPKPPEEKRPQPDEEPLSPRLISAQYRTQIAIVQNTVLFTMLNQLGTNLNDLPPEIQQQLQSISYQAVESLILEKSLTPEGREYLQKLATNPLSRYEFYFKAWTKISLYSDFNQVQQKIVQVTYEKIKQSSGGQAAANQYLETLEQVRQINIDQIRQGTIKLVNDKQSAESLAEIDKLRVSSNFQEDFQQKFRALIGENTFNPAQLINIEQNIAICAVNRLSPQYLESLSPQQLMVMLGLPPGLASDQRQLHQLLVDYYTLKIAQFDLIFGAQASITRPVGDDELAKNLNSQEKLEKYVTKHFLPYRQAFQENQYSPEDLVAAYNSNLNDLSLLDKQRQEIEGRVAAEIAAYEQFLENFKLENAQAIRKAIIDAMLLQDKEAVENLAKAMGGIDEINIGELPFLRGSDLTSGGTVVAGDTADFAGNSHDSYRQAFRNDRFSPNLRPFNKIGSKTKQFLGKAGKKIKQAADAVDDLAMKAITAWNPAVGKFLTAIPKPVRQFAAVAVPAYLLAPLATIGGTIGGGLGAALGGAIGSIFPAVGTAIGATGGYIAGSQLGMRLAPWKWGDVGLGGGKAASGASSAFGQTASGLGNAAGQMGSSVFAPSNTGAAATGAGTTGGGATAGGLAAAKSSLVTLITNPAVYSTVGAIGTVTVAMIANDTAIKQAFLADFQGTDPTAAQNAEKTSSYFEVEKTVETGCPENKCTTPPGKVTYTITIKPKGTYQIAIRDITDELKVEYNKDEWKDGIPTGTNLKKDLKDITKDLDPALVQKYLNNSLNERLPLPPEGITISYQVDLNDKYNHANVRNMIEVKVYVAEAGFVDTATGYTLVKIGNPPKGVGCWPTTGTISQLPWGGYSHWYQTPGGAWIGTDAFDIGGSIGLPIYTPFSGMACSNTWNKGQYGWSVVLNADNGFNFIFAHMAVLDTIPEATCKHVEAGDYIGPMGDTGFSDGPHLHYAVSQSGAFYNGSKKDYPQGSAFILNNFVPRSKGDPQYGQVITESGDTGIPRCE